MASGGARVPDGVARPKPIPGGQGSNRTDLSALPGTPGTPLPPNPIESAVGSPASARRRLSQIPVPGAQPGAPLLDAATEAPGEPVTAGVAAGAGLGPEALLAGPEVMSSKVAANDVKYFYPIIMRLSALPNASQQTKILAQRLRANLSLQPEQIPLFPGEEVASGIHGTPDSDTQGSGGPSQSPPGPDV